MQTSPIASLPLPLHTSPLPIRSLHPRSLLLRCNALGNYHGLYSLPPSISSRQHHLQLFTIANESAQVEEVTASSIPNLSGVVENARKAFVSVEDVLKPSPYAPINGDSSVYFLVVSAGLLLVFWVGNYLVPDLIFRNTVFKKQAQDQKITKTQSDGLSSAKDEDARFSGAALNAMEQVASRQDDERSSDFKNISPSFIFGETLLRKRAGDQNTTLTKSDTFVSSLNREDDISPAVNSNATPDVFFSKDGRTNRNKVSGKSSKRGIKSSKGRRKS